jgi:hypothetical protein
MRRLNRAGLRYSAEYYPAEDLDLWERAVDCMKLANLPEVLLWYRYHPGQTSFRQSPLQRLAATRIKARALARRNICFTMPEFDTHCALVEPERAPRLPTLQEVRRWLHKLCATTGPLSAEGRALRRECAGRRRALRSLRRAVAGGGQPARASAL